MNAGNAAFFPAAIKFLTGPLAGRTFSINKPITTIGRNSDNDIVVPDDQRVSRQHVRLLWNNGSWFIEKHPQAASAVIVNRQLVPFSEMRVASLELTNNTSVEKHTYTLNQDVINIGRDPSNDIVIKDRIVSSFHAQIVRVGNQFVLIHPHPDRQQTLNGLYYRGRKIPGDEPFRKALTRNDIFRIGDENGTFV